MVSLSALSTARCSQCFLRNAARALSGRASTPAPQVAVFKSHLDYYSLSYNNLKQNPHYKTEEKMWPFYKNVLNMHKYCSAAKKVSSTCDCLELSPK